MAGVCGNDEASVTTQLNERLLPRMGPWTESGMAPEVGKTGRRYCRSSRKITHQQQGSSAGIQEENLEIIPLLLEVKKQIQTAVRYKRLLQNIILFQNKV